MTASKCPSDYKYVLLQWNPDITVEQWKELIEGHEVEHCGRYDDVNVLVRVPTRREDSLRRLEYIENVQYYTAAHKIDPDFSAEMQARIAEQCEQEAPIEEAAGRLGLSDSESQGAAGSGDEQDSSTTLNTAPDAEGSGAVGRVGLEEILPSFRIGTSQPEDMSAPSSPMRSDTYSSPLGEPAPHGSLVPRNNDDRGLATDSREDDSDTDDPDDWESLPPRRASVAHLAQSLPDEERELRPIYPPSKERTQQDLIAWPVEIGRHKIHVWDMETFRDELIRRKYLNTAKGTQIMANFVIGTLFNVADIPAILEMEAVLSIDPHLEEMED